MESDPLPNNQGKPQFEWLDAITADQTITEPVRQRALQFAREWKTPSPNVLQTGSSVVAAATTSQECSVAVDLNLPRFPREQQLVYALTKELKHAISSCPLTRQSTSARLPRRTDNRSRSR